MTSSFQSVFVILPRMRLLKNCWLMIGVFLIGGTVLLPLVHAQNATFEAIESSEVSPTPVADPAVSEDPAMVYMFGRDDCGFCKKQKEFFAQEDITYVYLNIVTDELAKNLYNQVVEKHELTKVTPITVIGE